MDIHFTDHLPARNTYLRLVKRAVCDSTDRYSRINCMNSFMEVKVVLTFVPAPSTGSLQEHCGLCAGSHGPAPLLAAQGQWFRHFVD